MVRWSGHIEGTINDEFSDIEADTEEEAREKALKEWCYVEFQDLDVASISPQKDSE